MVSEPEAQDYMSLPMWTVYEKPLDFPMEFVARLHRVGRDGPVPTDEFVTGSSLEEVRSQLPPGLFRSPRDPDDDPVIVETWF